MQDRNIDALVLVDGGNDLHGRAYPDVAADMNTTRGMYEALLPNPRVVPDLENVLVVALENRLVSYVHVVADPDVVGMENKYTRFENNILADRTEGGIVDRAVAVTARR